MKGIILDWGRTLWDTDNNQLFPETKNVLEQLKKKYKLALVSVCTREPISVRWNKIKQHELNSFFETVLMHSETKNHLLDLAMERLQCAPNEIAVIGDNALREIAWGNQKGCITIWIQKGMYAQKTPTQETGQPTHTITNLSQVFKLI